MTHKRTVLALTATEDEYSILRQHLKGLHDLPGRPTRCEQGLLECESGVTWKVIIAQTGQRSMQASDVTAEVVERYGHPRLAFFIGTALGLKDAKPGDVVVGNSVYAHQSEERPDKDIVRTFGGGMSHDLAQEATRISRSWRFRGHEGASLLVGTIVTGNAISKVRLEESDEVQKLRASHGDAIAYETEGVGFHTACHKRGIAHSIIRGISDEGENKEELELAGYKTIAIEAACDVWIRLLSEYHLPPDTEEGWIQIALKPISVSRKVRDYFLASLRSLAGDTAMELDGGIEERYYLANKQSVLTVRSTRIAFEKLKTLDDASSLSSRILSGIKSEVADAKEGSRVKKEVGRLSVEVRNVEWLHSRPTDADTESSVSNLATLIPTIGVLLRTGQTNEIIRLVDTLRGRGKAGPPLPPDMALVRATVSRVCNRGDAVRELNRLREYESHKAIAWYEEALIHYGFGDGCSVGLSMFEAVNAREPTRSLWLSLLSTWMLSSGEAEESAQYYRAAARNLKNEGSGVAAYAGIQMALAAGASGIDKDCYAWLTTARRCRHGNSPYPPTSLLADHELSVVNTILGVGEVPLAGVYLENNLGVSHARTVGEVSDNIRQLAGHSMVVRRHIRTLLASSNTLRSLVRLKDRWPHLPLDVESMTARLHALDQVITAGLGTRLSRPKAIER